MKNFRKNIVEIEEKLTKQKKDSDAKAHGNFHAFIAAQKAKELNASMDQAVSDK